MTIALDRLSRFFFEPSEAFALGVTRLVVYGSLFVLYVNTDFSAWASVSDVFWQPRSFFGALHLPVLSAESLTVLQVVWKLALVTSAVGLLTRASTATSFVLGFYLLGLPQNMGKIHHEQGLVVIVLGILMLSRCGDAISVDSLLRRRRDRARTGESGEYTWPIRLVWLSICLVFLAAGIAKLRNGGLDWVTSENLARLLVRAHYYESETNPPLSWGLDIARYPLLASMLAGATLLLELSYPLALFSGRARALLVPGMVVAQLSIRALLGPSFPTFAALSLVWIPWNELRSALRGRRGQPARPPPGAADARDVVVTGVRVPGGRRGTR